MCADQNFRFVISTKKYLYNNYLINNALFDNRTRMHCMTTSLIV